MSEKYSRRDFLTGVLVCGTLSTAAISMFPQSRPMSHVELKLMTGSDSTGGRQLLIDMWNWANPDTTVHTVISEGPTGDQKRDMETAAANGSVDIVNLDTIHIRSFVDKELIEPVEVDDAAVFLASTLRANRTDRASHLWAVPYNTDVGMLFERVPSGERAETPKLSTVIDRIPDGSVQFVGQLGPASSASHEAFVVNVLEHALSRNSEILNPDGIPVYDLGAWRDALAPLQAALGKGRVFAASSEDDTMTRFMADPKPRYMRNWPVSYRNLQKKLDQDARSGRIEVHKLPIGILGGQSLAVVAKSRHVDRAADVIRFLTGEQAQKVLASHGLAPTRLAAYNDSNLVAFIPHLGSIRGAVEDARPRPSHGNYETFASAVVHHVQRFLAEKIELPSKFIDDIRDALK